MRDAALDDRPDSVDEAPPPTAVDVERALEQHRVELTAYCYRMLGSPFDAEDAVQETLVRAWKAADRFEGRSSIRSWLYRIATNVCLDVLGGTQRRVRPMDLGGASTPDAFTGATRPDGAWVLPAPDGRVVESADDPAEQVVSRESVRLAFVAALQHLPARQRAVLILREVLRWKADEVAELLGTTVASVNSALQRARATMDTIDPATCDTVDPDDPAQRELLSRFLEAFEAYDVDALLTLMRDDVVQSMPPYDFWLQGRDAIKAWYLGEGIECSGSRLVPTAASGMPAFGQYRPSGPGGRHEPWSLTVLEIADGQVVHVNSFLDTAALFPLFGLPSHPDDAA